MAQNNVEGQAPPNNQGQGQVPPNNQGVLPALQAVPLVRAPTEAEIANFFNSMWVARNQVGAVIAANNAAGQAQPVPRDLLFQLCGGATSPMRDPHPLTLHTAL